ncbi:hypothetical protein D3C72_2157700 [compost metagenome]
MLAALVDMAERPIVETRCVQVGEAAGGVDVVAGRTVEAGVHDADIDPVGERRPVFRQQAFRRLRAGEA